MRLRLKIILEQIKIWCIHNGTSYVTESLPVAPLKRDDPGNK